MDHDDYGYKTLEAKYDDMTAERLSAMTADERGSYYHDLYQYFGRGILILHRVEKGDGEEDLYPSLSTAETSVLSAAHNAFIALLDSLVALVEVAEAADDQ